MHQTVNVDLKSIVGSPLGMPYGVPSQTFVNPIKKPSRVESPEKNLPKAVNYLADYGGCGFYRCIAPNLLLNLNEKAVIHESSTMVLDPRYYLDFRAVKFQRQGTNAQRKFIEDLKELQKDQNFKLIFEIDDVVFAEDIPLYNRNREAFTPPQIQDNIKAILQLMDEVVVTTPYFKQYLERKTGLTNITSIPNYLMKWWFDRYYNLGNLIKSFEQNKKKPKIGIFASGTHYDILNRVQGKDDLDIVNNFIIKTKTDFEWHFFGGLPTVLRPHVSSGHIKYSPWSKLSNFAETMYNSGVQMTFASLQDNEFNRCKSNIKLIEAGALGLPCVCPDLPCYEDAPLKYKTGEEFIDVIKATFKNQTSYAEQCKKARNLACNYWLDDEQNLMKHHEVYFTPFGSKERKFLT